MTICLAVTGRHVERLNFLDVMFGDEPRLSPPEIFYPHTLAGDPVEEVDRAEKLLKEQPLSSYYDDVALGGLKLAQNDLARGSLDPARIEKIRASIAELVDDLSEQDDWLPLPYATKGTDVTSAVVLKKKSTATLTGGEAADEWRAEEPVLCIAGRSGLDESVALMLAQLLEKHGLSARVEGPEALSSSGTFRVRRRASASYVFLTSTPTTPRICVTPSGGCARDCRTPKSSSVLDGQLRHRELERYGESRHNNHFAERHGKALP